MRNHTKILIFILLFLGNKKIFTQTDSSIIIRNILKLNGFGLAYERVIVKHFTLNFSTKCVTIEPYYDFSWRGGEAFPRVWGVLNNII